MEAFDGNGETVCIVAFVTLDFQFDKRTWQYPCYKQDDCIDPHSSALRA